MTSGAMKPAMMCHTVSVVSLLSEGLASATDSPPTSCRVPSYTPSTRISTKVRSYERPKLVSKKCTSGRRQRNNSIFSTVTRTNYTRRRSGLSLPRDRGSHRSRQDASRGTAGHETRGDDGARGHGESVPRRLLRRSPGVGAPGAAVLPAQPPSSAYEQAPGRSVPADDDLRLRLRQGQDLRVPESRRQRAVHLPAVVRSARPRRAPAGSRRAPAGADGIADGAAAHARETARGRGARSAAAARRRVFAGAQRSVSTFL